ncbi:MAG: DUF6726 family protein [Candidatus Anammoxibacter sp.]
MKFITLFFVLLFAGQLVGCFASKIVTVPMRVSGAVISVVPVVGNTVDKAIDEIADIIDN